MDNQLTKQHNAGSLLRFAVPTIVMTVFMSLYTMVDGIFVANCVSPDALSGLNLVIPGLSILVALSVLISAGGSVVISRKLGENKLQEAREDLSFLVLLTIVFGLVVMALVLIFARPILMLLGATENLYPIALGYYQTLALFTVPCLLQVQFQYFFVTAGAPSLGLICVVLGGVSNVILDYVFMVTFTLGIRGAALATGIGYSIPAIVGLVWFSINKKGLLHFTRPRARVTSLRESIINGVASMIINLAGATVTWLYNRIIILYLGETGIAAATIVLYVRFLFNSFLSGYSSGVAPLISYNFGRQDFSQVKLLFRTSLAAVLVGSALVFGISIFSADRIVLLFASEEPYLASLARHGIFLFSFSYLFNGVNTFSATLFSALSNGKLSALMAFLNTFVFLIGFMVLLPRLGLDADGVWLAVPAAECCSLFLTVFFLKRNRAVYNY